jgi:hypothetical protein
MDKTANRNAVAKWRNKKFSQGCKGITVYLSAEVLDMIKLLHRHFRTRRKTAELIEKAIRNLYENNRPKMS